MSLLIEIPKKSNSIRYFDIRAMLSDAGSRLYTELLENAKVPVSKQPLPEILGEFEKLATAENL
jgi:hypothetical protein